MLSGAIPAARLAAFTPAELASPALRTRDAAIVAEHIRKLQAPPPPVRARLSRRGLVVVS